MMIPNSFTEKFQHKLDLDKQITSVDVSFWLQFSAYGFAGTFSALRVFVQTIE